MPQFPLTQYVMYAGRYHQEHAGEADHPVYRNPAWDFTRLIKSYRSLRELDADAALEFVITELERVAAGAHDRWLVSIGVEEDDAVPAFLEAWDKVAVLVGTTIVTEAERLARGCPAITAENLGLRRTPSYVHLLNVCLYLQAERGDGFFMSCRTAASIIGSRDHVPAWRLLNLMTRDGFLSVVRRGRAGAPGSEATRYRLNLDRLPADAVETAERELGRRLRDDGSDE